jgi:predicted 3-demethylubiquinone-9 3-methyltransferase (glyoxalase superfamily)
LNGGPQFKFTEAISLVMNCESQEEVDELWEKLGEGGQYQRSGLAQGQVRPLLWQIVPTALIELISDPDPVKSRRVMEAMLQMTKIDIAKLRQAHQS